MLCCNCLEVKEMSVMYDSVHVAIRLLHMNSIKTPNQTISNVCTKYIFQRFFSEKISILPICIMKKFNLEVLYKRNHFGLGICVNIYKYYWDVKNQNKQNLNLGTSVGVKKVNHSEELHTLRG